MVDSTDETGSGIRILIYPLSPYIDYNSHALHAELLLLLLSLPTVSLTLLVDLQFLSHSQCPFLR